VREHQRAFTLLVDICAASVRRHRRNGQSRGGRHVETSTDARTTYRSLILPYGIERISMLINCSTREDCHMERRGLVSYGTDSNEDILWKKHINRTVYFFSKVRLKPGTFLYNCEASPHGAAASPASSTGFQSNRDLNLEEVENSSQFAEFVFGRS
jgi:hypothetical protein